MTAISVTPVDVMAGLGVLLVLLLVWRASARRVEAAADAARAGARLVSLTGRMLCNAALIVAVQWVVITYQANDWVLLALLGLPALFASYALTRALTVTTINMPRHRGGGRRGQDRVGRGSWPRMQPRPASCARTRHTLTSWHCASNACACR